ncbi:MAG: carboxypeptidase regulatory-like domain-containing protein [Pyrinomonadaceae bacterium]
MKNLLSGRSKFLFVLLCAVAGLGVYMKSGPVVSSQRVSRTGTVDSGSRAIGGTSFDLGRISIPPKFTPQSGSAVQFAESRPISEIAKEENAMLEAKRAAGSKIEALGGDPDNRRPWNFWISREENEKNRFNRQIIRKIDPNAPGTPDEALAAVPETGKKGVHTSSDLVAQSMPTPSLTFEGISEPDTVAIGQGFLPPDTNGEIGPNHYVLTVNVGFRIYDRAGTPLVNLATIGSLFAALPGPCGLPANANDGDAIVLYDQLADRWLISEFCVSVADPNNHQIIAISKTSDPTGAYYLYDFKMPNNDFNDYPHFGMWPDGYYMTDNEFDQAGTQSLGAGTFAFDRKKMIAGDPTATFIYFDLNAGCPAACLNGGMLPTDLDGFIPPPAGTPNTIAQFDADEYGAGHSDRIQTYAFHADFTTPANSTLTAKPDVPVAAFDPREVPLGSRAIVPQPPGGVNLDVISDRLMFRLAYRNQVALGHESLVMAHTVNAAVNPAFRSGVRYYELQRPNPASNWGIFEQGTMAGAAGDTENRWMGSTALNNAGSQAVGYSVSSATVFPSIRYAGRLAGDAPGSLGQGEATLIAGAGVQTSTSNRWGDYSDMTVDPVDDCTFWYTQEYYPATGSATWHTRVGKFQFGPCPARPTGTLSGTVTSSAGGTPINGAIVAANGYQQQTAAAGTYSMNPIGAGAYNVTASATGYISSTAPGVNITTGVGTVQNFVLTPLSIPQPGAASITAESCAPANGAIDPGETVTVNLPVINNGGAGASTTNLIGTLLATGGVSSPSGAQTYGSVVQGGAAVTKPFTFTASTTCGQTLTATLHLTDGATDYGNVTYTFLTGVLGAATPLSVTTGNIATAIPDVTTVDIPLPNISQSGSLVADVNVKVRLNHTFDGDLNLSLVAPDNTIVPLATRRPGAGVAGANYGSGINDCSGTPTIFDDSAATTIAAGAVPYAGTFKPESPLSILNGKSISGVWKLRVSDNAAADTGTVGCVSLDFQKQAISCCGVSGTPQMASGGAAPITFENGTPPNGVPDPGETVTANFPIINTGTANTASMVATLQNTGGITPLTTQQNYGVVVAGGAAVAKPFSFRANGTCGGTVTATLALADGAVNLGTVTYTFPLGTSTTSGPQTFSNSTALVIPATGTGASTGAPASPYPSSINVSGVPGTVSKMTVNLTGLNHTFPSDVDMLLVGPGGQKFTLLSDVIGGTAWVNINYTLDDAAAGLIPSTGTPASGTFKPTNYTAGDAFPAPAPASPYNDPASVGTATFASVFNGSNPNGTWSLYVVDDASADTGTMTGGWSISITTSVPSCTTPTAARVGISGRVLTPDGAGLRNASISIRDQHGNVHTAISSAFGYYHFDDVEMGSYLVSVASRRYTYTSRLVNVTDNLVDLNFSPQ